MTSVKMTSPNVGIILEASKGRKKVFTLIPPETGTPKIRSQKKPLALDNNPRSLTWIQQLKASPH